MTTEWWISSYSFGREDDVAVIGARYTEKNLGTNGEPIPYGGVSWSPGITPIDVVRDEFGRLVSFQPSSNTSPPPFEWVGTSTTFTFTSQEYFGGWRTWMFSYPGGYGWFDSDGWIGSGLPVSGSMFIRGPGLQFIRIDVVASAPYDPDRGIDYGSKFANHYEGTIYREMVPRWTNYERTNEFGLDTTSAG